MWSSASCLTDSNSRSGPSAISDLLATRRHGRSWLIVGLLVVSLIVVGCPLTWQRVSINETIAPEDVAFIIPGKTTLAEIVARLGAPDEITSPDGRITYTPFGLRMITRTPQVITASYPGAVARYRFLDFKRFRANFTWGLKFIQPVPGIPDDFVFESGGIGTDEFLVVLDSNWIVRQHAFAKHADASRYRPWPFDLEPPDDNQVVSF